MQEHKYFVLFVVELERKIRYSSECSVGYKYIHDGEKRHASLEKPHPNNY